MDGSRDVRARVSATKWVGIFTVMGQMSNVIKLEFTGSITVGNTLKK